jgi:hypothetical protein
VDYCQAGRWGSSPRCCVGEGLKSKAENQLAFLFCAVKTFFF